MKSITLIHEPIVEVVGKMSLDFEGIARMGDWLATYRSECMPPNWAELRANGSPREAALSLFPHTEVQDGTISHNEALVELAGRGCYLSYGEKAGRKSNHAYVENLLGKPGRVPHGSVIYQAKLSFFFAGISRRMTHELIRHYVGADREEEGSPSQQSTRYVEHPGHFIVHPRHASASAQSLEHFRDSMQLSYDNYLYYINTERDDWCQRHSDEPKGMDYKRILEAGAMYLPGAAATSMIWGTNPMALAKLFRERLDYAADMEIQRFAALLKERALAVCPNLFQQG